MQTACRFGVLAHTPAMVVELGEFNLVCADLQDDLGRIVLMLIVEQLDEPHCRQLWRVDQRPMIA